MPIKAKVVTSVVTEVELSDNTDDYDFYKHRIDAWKNSNGYLWMARHKIYGIWRKFYIKGVFDQNDNNEYCKTFDENVLDGDWIQIKITPPPSSVYTCVPLTK